MVYLIQDTIETRSQRSTFSFIWFSWRLSFYLMSLLPETVKPVGYKTDWTRVWVVCTIFSVGKLNPEYWIEFVVNDEFNINLYRPIILLVLSRNTSQLLVETRQTVVWLTRYWSPRSRDSICPPSKWDISDMLEPFNKVEKPFEPNI